MKFALAMVLTATSAFALQVDVLVDSGPVANRLNLVILGDGYRAQDQAKLSDDAAKVIGGLFQFHPYADYAPLFNVKLVHVISNDNGADNGQFGAVRDTALDSEFGCFGIARLLCVDEAKSLMVASQNVPEVDQVVVVVNDSTYGGSGGGVVAISTDSNAIDILRHELGHSLAHLADEYTDPYPGYPTCSGECPEPNATLHSMSATVKWSAWVDSTTPVPTTGTAALVGAYEGCRYQTTGVFRPYPNCIMKALGKQFCPVCSEAMVLSFWRFVNQIDTHSPAASNVNASACTSASFSVTTPDAGLKFTWSIDGAPLANASSALVLALGAVDAGVHHLAVTVSDPTARVRTDPSALLVDSSQWSVTVPPQCAAGVCQVVGCAADNVSCAYAPQESGTLCGAIACANGMLTASACDGDGGCAETSPTSCAPYGCGSTTACASTCATNDECFDDTVCVSSSCVTPTPVLDAGTPPMPPPNVVGTCGCSQTLGVGSLALIALLRLALRRRR